MPNQRALAAALGLSQTTVARALRGSPRVKPATLLRVQEAAREFGYRANPMVATLMEHIRTGRDMTDQGSIAILVDTETGEDKILQMDAYRLHLEGFESRAKLRGYNTEFFYLRGKGMSAGKLDRILYARGYAGIILSAPSRQESASFTMKWERYALGTVGANWSHLSIDRAASNHRANVHLAFQELVLRGYRRIGLVLPAGAFNPNDSNWLAGYLACQHFLPKSHRLPVFAGSVPEGSGGDFRKWCDRWKPDALLCLLGEEREWIESLSLRAPLPLVCLALPSGSGLSGIDEKSRLVGELTCDIVVNHIIHNERGQTADPRLVLVKGRWVEGSPIPWRKK